MIGQTPDWGIVALIGTALFAGLLIATRIAVESRRGRLAFQREIPGLLGILTGLAVAALVILGVSPYLRLIVPAYFFVAGFILLASRPQRWGRFLTSQGLGWLAIAVGAIGLVASVVSTLA